MNKNFAKIPFTGKSMISLSECHSTNEYMADLAAEGQLKHGDVVTADFQTNGKGQRGNIWLSEKGQNLLFSVFVKPRHLNAEDAYLLTLTTGLAITKLLDDYLVSQQVKLKWPNDVYVNDRKIAGVLIETSLKTQLEYAIVGIGLNVNQTHFHLPNATSIKLESNTNFSRSKVLEDFLYSFDELFDLLQHGQTDLILSRYHDRLYWRGEKHIYGAFDEEFEAELIGIDKQGHLVLNRDGELKHFRTREVSFIN